VVVFLLDAAQTIGRGDVFIAGELERIKTPVVCAVNKSDLVSEDKLRSQLEVARHLGPCADVIAISARVGSNLESLVETLASFLEPGPRYFPEGTVSDQPERLLVAELIREQALELTRDEVPHSVAVIVEEMSKREGEDLVDIEAVIYMERESQKGIIVGKGGRMIKEIGSRARQEIEPLLGNRVFLDLRVKVEKDWSRRPDFIRRLDCS